VATPPGLSRSRPSTREAATSASRTPRDVVSPRPRGRWGRSSLQNLVRAHVENLVPAAGCTPLVVADHACDVVGVTVLDLPRPTDEARSDEAVCSMVRAHDREPLVLDLGTTESPHLEITAALGRVLARASALRDGSAPASPAGGRTTPDVRWPVVVLRTPAGWGSPHVPRDHDDRCDLAGTPAVDPVDVPRLEAWLRSYRPRASFLRGDVPGEPAR
jgi:hypothetical protein